MNKVNETIFANEIKLLFFILLISGIILFLGYIISEFLDLGFNGIAFFLLITVITNFSSYFFSKDIVLKSQHAIPIREDEYSEYCSMVKDICNRNNIKYPELYYINSSSLNAFATGRNQNNAAIVITSGMLKNVPLDEISGVIGHELSHIIHKDIMITSFISVMLGCVALLASVIKNSVIYKNKGSKSSNSPVVVFAIIASFLMPIIATLIRMAVSRSREYMADATGGKLCGNPQLLANALKRISSTGSTIASANEATAPIYISNPLSNSLSNLFSTHPDISDRIERLEKMNYS